MGLGKKLAIALGVLVVIRACLPVGMVDAITDAQTIKVVDGDSLEVNGRRVRLFGIDAPELMQVCRNQFGLDYHCGLEAREWLANLVKDQRLTCQAVKKDTYGRELAICKTRAGLDIGGTQVLNGQAVNYSRYTGQYRDEEAKARSAKRGLWRGQFENPEDYRHRNDGRPSPGRPFF